MLLIHVIMPQRCSDDVLNLFFFLFVHQDYCLSLLARCLALIPVEKLENILRDTQVSSASIVVSLMILECN